VQNLNCKYEEDLLFSYALTFLRPSTQLYFETEQFDVVHIKFIT
jgi:hypothetical protein